MARANQIQRRMMAETRASQVTQVKSSSLLMQYDIPHCYMNEKKNKKENVKKASVKKC